MVAALDRLPSWGSEPEAWVSPSRDAASCLRCGARTQVVDSRVRRGLLVRRRACPKCGHRHSTGEVVLDAVHGTGAARDMVALIASRTASGEPVPWKVMRALLAAVWGLYDTLAGDAALRREVGRAVRRGEPLPKPARQVLALAVWAARVRCRISARGGGGGKR